MRYCVVAALLALASGCEQRPEGPVCGLHSAGAAVLLETGDKENPRRPLAVGAQLMPDDRIVATGPALIECYGGAFKVLEKGDKARIWDLKEAKLQGVTLPVKQLSEGKAKEIEHLPRAIRARYSSNRFTPNSALADDKRYSSDGYLAAFFAPNGMESLQQADKAIEGPRKLPAPTDRPRVPTIHAGDSGDGPLLIKIDDEVVFLETDDLATSVLQEGKTYQVGRAIRLVLPEDAEATLELKDGKTLELDGPMELRLQLGQTW